jgi:hypothetical protein
MVSATSARDAVVVRPAALAAALLSNTASPDSGHRPAVQAVSGRFFPTPVQIRVGQLATSSIQRSCGRWRPPAGAVRIGRYVDRCGRVPGPAGALEFLLPGVACPQACSAALRVAPISVAAGASHTCAILADETVWCWGGNSSGQLGDGTTTSRDIPRPVTGLTGVRAVTAGANYSCALLRNNTVVCWGDNRVGTVGDGTAEPRLRPTAVAGLASVARVTAGHQHACAVTTSGDVYCWGRADMARLPPGADPGETCPLGGG